MKYLHPIWFLLFVYVPVITQGQVPFTCKGQYYLSLTKGGATSSGLYEVKISENGNKIYLDTIAASLGLVLNAMGYRITDNFIYGVDPNNAHLRRVGSDGVAVDLGVPLGIPRDPLYYAGDITPDGKYLLLIGLGANAPQIIKVDLDDPSYRCTFIPLQDKTVGIVDIAFDPFTGILYGHDLRNRKLVTINYNTGTVNTNFPVQPQVDQLGALFFDSFGNLYGYGTFGSPSQDKFVSINKVSGEISLLAQGPLSSGQDGCACPYTLELQKIVKPEITYPCTEVVYHFIVSNGSGILRSGIRLIDTMPYGIVPKYVLTNPFGGEVFLKDNVVIISNMNVSVGIDTIKIVAETQPDALGLYKNRAILHGLPLALGSFTYSDNPLTFIPQDSTVLEVIALDLTFIDTSYNTCPGDSIWANATRYGLKYLWEDGDTSSAKWLPSPGEYYLSVQSLCENKEIRIVIKDELLDVNILQDTLFVLLGETIRLISEYQNIDDKVVFLWKSFGNDDVFCDYCQNTEVLPLQDGSYKLIMTNQQGCVVEDEVLVRVKKDRSVYFPNVISANGDLINDIFYLSGNDLAVSGAMMLIFDRWGNKVFESRNFALNDVTGGWDGTFLGKPVVAGVYTWVANLVYIDGYTQTIKGDITVLK